MDPFGYHALSCSGPGCGRFSRHEVVVNALAHLAQSAGFGPPSQTTNSSFQCPSWFSPDQAPRRLRPADIYLIDDQHLCVDVTIVSPLSHAKSMTPAGRILGKTLLSAVAEKFYKHGQPCTELGKEFIPFALDSCGLTDHNAWKLMSRFATRMADRQGKSYSYLVNIVRRRISFALQVSLSRQLLRLNAPSALDWNLNFLVVGS